MSGETHDNIRRKVDEDVNVANQTTAVKPSERRKEIRNYSLQI